MTESTITAESTTPAPLSSEPLHRTKVTGLPADLTLAQIAGIMHLGAGTMGSVELHPRGCGTCEAAALLASRNGLERGALYRDELPAVGDVLAADRAADLGVLPPRSIVCTREGAAAQLDAHGYWNVVDEPDGAYRVSEFLGQHAPVTVAWLP